MLDGDKIYLFEKVNNYPRNIMQSPCFSDHLFHAMQRKTFFLKIKPGYRGHMSLINDEDFCSRQIDCIVVS